MVRKTFEKVLHPRVYLNRQKLTPDSVVIKMDYVRTLSLWRMYLHVILVLTCCAIVFSSENLKAEGSTGWLRVCNWGNEKTENRHYEVEADKCSHGAWFSEPLDGGCVCLNGAWSVSSGWCDDDYHILFGRAHCFQLNKLIQKVSYLGHGEDAFETANFITKENGHVFQQFNDEFFMPYEHSRETNSTIIRLKPAKEGGILLELNPNSSPEEDLYQRLFQSNDNFGDENEVEVDGPVCVKSNEGSEISDDNLMIHKFSTRLKSVRVLENCQKPKNDLGKFELGKELVSTLKVRSGQGVHVKSGLLLNSSNACPATCKPDNSISSSTPSEVSSSNHMIRHKRQANPGKGSEPPAPEAPPAISPNFEPLQLDREFTDEERDEMVNTANLRVVKQELNWLLESVRPPTIESRNWKLMQKIKQVFQKACPETETPKFLINAMMRLFRLLYINSRDFFPNGHIIEEEDQYARLNATLQACLDDTYELQFEYAHLKDEGVPCIERPNDDADEEEEPKKYCNCTTELDMINVTFTLNITGEPESFNLTKENKTMPQHLRFQLPSDNMGENVTFHDFPTETVWKMVSFTHFYCAKHFRYQGGDHSALMTKMEDFFNDDIIYRWTRPGRLSDKVWHMLYSAFDMKKFAAAVDDCVSAAKYVSEYPEWLNRPTLSMTRRRKRSLDTQELWNGKAYCLEDPWDPINKLGVSSDDNRCVDLNRY